jgi:hypothetical protein
MLNPKEVHNYQHPLMVPLVEWILIEKKIFRGILHF